MANVTYFRVASLNLWGRKGAFDARMDIVRKEITNLSPDVIFLQEVLLSGGKHLLIEALEAEGYNANFAATIEAEQGSAYGNALLSRLRLRANPALKLLTPTGAEPRNAVTCEFEVSGRKGLFLSTHLSSGDELEQARECQFLEVASLASKADFSIFGGDLNMEPSVFRRIASLSSRDVKDAHSKEDYAREYERLVEHNSNSISRGIRGKLDYILYFSSSEVELNVTKRGFFAYEPVSGVFPSDHIGVYGDFRILVD